MVTIGEVVAAYGLHGELRVLPHTDFPDRFARLEYIWVLEPGGRAKRRKLLRSRQHETKQQILLRLEGINSRVAARRLVGCMIAIPEEEVVELPEGTYFEHDILGLEVVTTDGRVLGKITDILHTGANDVYVTSACLIPAIPDVVREVDIAGGRMVIFPMPGLLGDE